MSIRVLRQKLSRFLADRRGATSAVMTLMLIPIVAALGMAVEGGGWYLVHRAAQNAADAASMAAAINGCEPGENCDDEDLGATYIEEAAAVAAKFGFAEDDDTDIATTKVICPGTTEPECFQVQITRRFPLSLVRLAGFNGDTTLTSGQPAQTIQAVAIAQPPEVSAEGFCMIGLGNVGNAITLNGMSTVSPGGGCDLRSNSGIDCNGANAQAFPDHSYSANGTNDCAAPENREINQGTIVDPYLYAQSGIPAFTCPGGTPAARYGTARTLAQADFSSTVVNKCGNTTLTGPINVTTANTVLVIRGGYLNLGNQELKTSGSGSLTIIFSGEYVDTGGTTYLHDLRGTNGGAVDKLSIRAPDSGPLRGIAVMQDSTLTGSRNSLAMDFSGNQPQLTIQGLIYLPNGTIDVGGAINFFNPDLHCIAIAAWNIRISGTGALADGASDDCVDAGLYVPTLPGAATREWLVQ